MSFLRKQESSILKTNDHKESLNLGINKISSIHEWINPVVVKISTPEINKHFAKS